MRKMLVLSACLLVASCAAAQSVRTKAKALQEVRAACGDYRVNFHVEERYTSDVVPPGQKDEARIYVFGMYGAGQQFGNPTIRLGMDGHWMGAIRGASYLFFSAEPGEHHLCAQWQSRFKGLKYLIWLTSVNVQADQAYYFLVTSIWYSSNSGLVQLNPLGSDEAQLLLAEYPQALSTAHK